MKGSFFQKATVPDGDLYRSIGQSAERPFIIKAAIVETSLGDLLTKLLCLATLKRQFDHAELHLRYRNVRPYSSEVVSLIPEIDSAVALKGHLPAWARLWIPDLRLWLPLARAIDGRKGSWASFCHFYPTDWMLNPRWLHAMPDQARLQVPVDRQDALERALIAQGLDPNRWFAVLHYRASNYLGKRSGVLRNSNPAAFQQLIDHIVDGLGGQVVLLGHPELQPFPPRKGFVDLSRIKNSFMLQIYAVSRARFLIGGPSGPVNFGWGFQIPTGMVDTVDGDAGWGPVEQVVLTKKLELPTGEVVQNNSFLATGLLDYRTLRDKIRADEDYTAHPNTIEELRMVADHLHRCSTDTPAWRVPAAAPEKAAPNHFVWPPKTRQNLRFIDP